jgi:hypothetical protein
MLAILVGDRQQLRPALGGNRDFTISQREHSRHRRCSEDLPLNPADHGLSISHAQAPLGGIALAVGGIADLTSTAWTDRNRASIFSRNAFTSLPVILK